MVDGNRLGRFTAYHGVFVKIDFKLDRKGVERIAVGRELGHACRSVVLNLAKPHAEGLAEGFRDTGDYARSFRVENTTDVLGPKRWPMRRVAVRLVNISDHAVIVEVGYKKNNRPHYVLRRTLQHLAAIRAVSLRRLPRLPRRKG